MQKLKSLDKTNTYFRSTFSSSTTSRVLSAVMLPTHLLLTAPATFAGYIPIAHNNAP